MRSNPTATPPRRSSLLAVLLAGTAAALVAGSSKALASPGPGTGERGARKQVERLTEWPKPEDKREVLLDIERLCKSRTPEMGVQAREALEAVGEASVPFLLERLGKERDKDAVKRIRDVLIANTSAAHTRLLAVEFDSKHAPTRVFALWRTAAFPDPGISDAAEAAWKRVEDQGDRADPDERYAAALCTVAAGSTAGLEVLVATATDSWDRRGAELRAALEGARGPKATDAVAVHLETQDRHEQVAALRLLAGCGDRTALPLIKPFLDDNDNQVRVSAINACRGIVDGAPPEDRLPVFEAIEVAKQWKEKI